MTITSFATLGTSQVQPGGPPGPVGPSGAFGSYKINAQAGTATYLATAADTGTLLLFSGTTSGVTFTINAAVLAVGWWVILKNNNVTGKITITLAPGPLIDGSPTMTIDPQCSATIIYGGLNFDTVGMCDGGTF
jgi:hypothetical protein